jgi:UDP-N-acetylglucosamine 2-epimerase (non-hydrolysing)
MYNVLIVVGTRPNFVKVTQFKRVAALYPKLDFRIVHTGQHYNANMTDVFFEQFGLEPDFFLDIPQNSPNSQIAEIMIRLERLIMETFRPALMIVVGDVNSTLAAALVANKLGILLAHLESGLRSFDRTMPEEINRIITDEIADLYFVTEQSGLDNLEREGKRGTAYFVGNTMIDTMVAYESNIQASTALDDLKVSDGRFVLMTMHRPATVDVLEELRKLVTLIERISSFYEVVFPIHPRTATRLREFGFDERIKACNGLRLTEPLDYFSFQKLIAHAACILTDSGGIQEETTFRQVPCLTLRSSTERPSTITIGSNDLMPFDVDDIVARIKLIQNGAGKRGEKPLLWDGCSTERIVKIIAGLSQ